VRQSFPDLGDCLFNPPNASFYEDGIPDTNWEIWDVSKYLVALDQVLTRFGPRIDVLEVENEPDDALLWTDGIDDPNMYNPTTKAGSMYYSPARFRLSQGDPYAEFFIAAAEQTRRQCPHIKIISGSTTGFSNRYKSFIREFLGGMKSRDKLALLDGIGIHPYRGRHAPQEHPASADEWGYDDLHLLSEVPRIIKSICDNLTISAPPVWITEIGYLTNQGADARHGLPPESQADYLVQSIFTAMTMRPELAMMEIYSDIDAGTRLSENYGLRYNDGRSKPAYDAVRFALQYATLWEPEGPIQSLVQPGGELVWSVGLKREGAKAFALWASDDLDREVALPFPEDCTRVKVLSYEEPETSIEFPEVGTANAVRNVTINLGEKPKVVLLNE